MDGLKLMDEVPKHVVIIPDGNRRWAKAQGKPVLEGHRVGIDKLRTVLEWAREFKVKTVTLWGFSLENFRRDRNEVEGLMKMLEIKFDEFKNHSDLHTHKIRVRFFGRLDSLSPGLRKKITEVESETAGYDKYNVNILLAYGGRSELVDACNAAIRDAKEGKITKVDEDSFGKYMYMSELEEPDLLIRTSGEQRLSGVLPWISGYSELYFSGKLWPDFGRTDFEEALKDFAHRKRRFGR